MSGSSSNTATSTTKRAASPTTKNPPYDLTAISKTMLRHLADNGEIYRVAGHFNALQTNCERVDYAYELFARYKCWPTYVHDRKNNAQATRHRETGNGFFRAKKLREAFDAYTKSVACAETNSSTLALAFANRSAVLFETELYRECLTDIQRAFDNNYPSELHEKLSERRKKANEKLLISDKARERYYEVVPVIPTDDKNPQIECASKCIEIKNDDYLGRHIIATRDINIGEIIAIEKSFAHILIENLTVHCHECLELTYNLIPCEHCTQTMYCSETCKTTAFKSYHQYECPILATTKLMQLDKLKMLPFKIACLIRHQYKDLDSNQIIYDANEIYHSTRYKEIHNLISNTEKRQTNDLFERAQTAALIYHLTEKYTDFFDNNDFATTKNVFKDLLLLHMQTGPCNFHQVCELAFNSTTGVFDVDEIAGAAFPFFSLINHSCNPNVVRANYGTTTVLRAIETIKKGEQCFDNYGTHYALMPKEERQAKLKKQYYFDCACSPCVENWTLYDSLSDVHGKLDILDEYSWSKLSMADVNTCKAIIPIAVAKVKKYEQYKPCKTYSHWQEVLKQCYVSFAGKRRLF